MAWVTWTLRCSRMLHPCAVLSNHRRSQRVLAGLCCSHRAYVNVCVLCGAVVVKILHEYLLTRSVFAAYDASLLVVSSRGTAGCAAHKRNPVPQRRRAVFSRCSALARR